MAIAVLIKPMVRDKDGFEKLAMLPDRDDREITNIDIDRNRHQVRVELAFHDLPGFDCFLHV